MAAQLAVGSTACFKFCNGSNFFIPLKNHAILAKYAGQKSLNISVKDFTKDLSLKLYVYYVLDVANTETIISFLFKYCVPEKGFFRFRMPRLTVTILHNCMFSCFYYLALLCF